MLRAFVAIGVLCRVTQYLWRRSYWHDESFLVLNIVGARVADAFGPLKLFQAAPPLFLIVQIYATRLLGASEYATRLVPLLLGCASVAMMATLARRVGGRFVACLATLMFAVSRQLVWHAVECKQYSGDVFVALLLLLLATGRDGARRFAAIAVVASVAVWFSHPTMFVFGGITLAATSPGSWARTRRGAATLVGANALFLASLAALYVSSIRPQQYPAMYTYWRHDFVPWDRPSTVPTWLVAKSLSLANYGYDNAGPIVLALAIFGGASRWRAGARRVVLLLTLPLALNLLASALHRFPFSGARVTVYAIPAIFILAAAGAEWTIDAAASTRWAPAARLLPTALAAIGVLPAGYALAVPRHRGHARPSADFVAARRAGDEPIYVVGKVEPWQCYLTDPAIRWRSIKVDAASTIADPRFWIVYVFTSSRDARRLSPAIDRAARGGTVTARIDVVGSTAAHVERRPPATTRRAGIGPATRALRFRSAGSS